MIGKWRAKSSAWVEVINRLLMDINTPYKSLLVHVNMSGTLMAKGAAWGGLESDVGLIFTPNWLVGSTTGVRIGP